MSLILSYFVCVCVCLYTFIYFFGKVNYENIYIEKSHSHPCLPHSSCYPRGFLLVTIFISFSYALSVFPYKYNLYISFLFSIPFLFFLY